MSENETGLKRSLEEEIQTVEEHKKQKLSPNVENEETKTETNTTTEAINDTLMQETNTQTEEIPKADKTDDSQAIEQEMVSADLSKPVTQIPDTDKTPSTSLEDASITSEQLLMALTSIHSEDLMNSGIAEQAEPVKAKPVAAEPVTSEAVTTEPVEEVTTTTTVIVSEEQVEDTEMTETTTLEQKTTETEKPQITEMIEPQTTEAATSEPMKSPPPPATTSENLTGSTSPPPPAAADTGLGITPKDDIPPSSSPVVPPASAPVPAPQTSTTHIGSPLKNVSSPNVSSPNVSSPSVSSPMKFNNNTDTASSLSATLSAAPNISISNLPDIKAALRRLSSANVSASVIEQLSSNERKGSITDVSPSEILGNALAAVAATAARSNSSTPTTPQASTSTNNTNAAAAIGNLAAITANISNLLHSGGFQRNSFSQEDTQKLAAAVAQDRRKSSIALVNNAFTNMIDMMGGRKPASKPKLIVKNEQVWKSIEGIEESSLGFQLYSPHLLLPNLENNVNGLMEVLVPARFLTFDNVKVQKRAVWGTDIYTDDSDIVAMIIHSGKYQPTYIEPTIEANDPFALAVAGKQKEATEATRKMAFSGKQYIRRYDHLIPDHDLKVTVRVLPKLQHYASSIRHKLKSREWHQHDGMSLYVDKVEKIKRGDAKLKGRSSLKSNMFAYETYRKKALGMNTQKKQSDPLNDGTSSIQKGRIKKSSRVLRMFKIHSELKKNT